MYCVNRSADKAERRIKGMIKICNTEIYMLGEGSVDLGEYNPNLKVKSSKDSFWEFLEREYKLNVKGEFSFENFQELIQNKKYGRFESGKIEVQKTYERFISLHGPNKFGYIVILGKRGWDKKRAIKRKLDVGIEGGSYERNVSISEFTRESFIKTVEDICGCGYKDIVKRYMGIVKKEKHRVVFVDRYDGYVYGVSYSEAVTQDCKREEFKQIEVEFWSKILTSSNYDRKRDVYSKSNHMLLIEEIKASFLKKELILESGKSKYEWLRKRKEFGKLFFIEKEIFD